MKMSKECRNIPESKDYLAFLQSYDAVGLRLNIDFFSFKKRKYIYLFVYTLQPPRRGGCIFIVGIMFLAKAHK